MTGRGWFLLPRPPAGVRVACAFSHEGRTVADFGPGSWMRRAYLVTNAPTGPVRVVHFIAADGRGVDCEPAAGVVLAHQLGVIHEA